MVSVRWWFGLFQTVEKENPQNKKEKAKFPEAPGIEISAKISMPNKFETEPSKWYVNLVKTGRKIYNEKNESMSPHSQFGQKGSVNGKWALDSGFPYFGHYFKPDKNGKLVNLVPKEEDFFIDTPYQQWDTPLKKKGDWTMGVNLAAIDNFNVTKSEFTDEEFKTFLMFQSQRKGQLAFPVPIKVYSGWKLNGSVQWNKKTDLYEMVREGKSYQYFNIPASAGKEIFPSLTLLPEWNVAATPIVWFRDYFISTPAREARRKLCCQF